MHTEAPPHPWLAAGRRLLAATAASLAFAAPPARAEAPPLREVPVQALAGAAKSNVPLAASGLGLEVPVETASILLLALQGAEELEMEYQASGILLLTFLTVDSSARSLPDHRGPPYRYVRVPPGRGRLDLDLLSAPHWSRTGIPYLLLEGSGRFTITRLRYRPSPSDRASVREALDRAVFFAPLPIGYTTVNILEPPYWSYAEGSFLYDRLGAAFLILAGILILGYLLARRRSPPAPALALAALAVAAPADLLFLGKLARAAPLSVHLDPEVRIRENYAYAPKLGALAALARATLRPDDRVAVEGHGPDWFAPEALCFNLAPRRCVTIRPGEREYLGLAGVDRLRPDEIDAIVSIDADRPLPDGFSKVAEVSDNTYVARRR